MGSSTTEVTAPPRRGLYFARPLRVLAVLLPTVIFGGFSWYDFRAERNRAIEDQVSTVDALAEHAQAIQQTAELVLARILDHIVQQDWTTLGRASETHAFLVRIKQDLPQLESAFLVSPEGRNVATSRQFPAEPISDSDRDYFRIARAGSVRSYVSGSFRGRIARTYAFTVTRPRLRPEGFDGLVGVTISPQYFETFYKALLKHPRDAAVALIRDDGAILARFPDATLPGTLAPTAPLLRVIRARQESGHVSDAFGDEARDGRTEFRRLQGWPVTVAYTIDRDLYMHAWYLHMILFALSAGLVAISILWAERVMLRTADRQNRVLLRLVDETQRRQKAEAALLQAQKVEALGRLTGGVAHDFNNLLAAILGSLELLQKHLTAPRPLRLIATARKAAERGAQLTSQMLAFSRQKDMKIAPVNVSATVSGMDPLLRQTTGALITIRYRTCGEACHAMADQAQLEVALLNLVSNARDAMAGGGDLVIGCQRVVLEPDGDLPAGPYIEIFVADDGSGMPEAVRARVFEPFFTTKGLSKGTGLGLSMVYGFATMSGGSATVESAPGAGTTVRILLPEAIAQDAVSDQSSSGAAKAVTAGDGSGEQRILLVDDDGDVRSTVDAMLEDLGYTVVVAESAAAALQILGNDRMFDLLVTDFAMPNMNGGELAQAVRADWPDAPFLLVTGYAEKDALVAWRSLGIPVLGKPFNQQDLSVAVRQAIEHQTPARRCA